MSASRDERGVRSIGVSRVPYVFFFRDSGFKLCACCPLMTPDCYRTQKEKFAKKMRTNQTIADEEKKRLLRKITGLPNASISALMLEKTNGVNWHNLPTSPIAGFELREEGLWDTDTNSVLTGNSLRELINETAKLEASAHQGADCRLAGTAVYHGFDAIEILYPPGLMLMSAWFGLWKIPRAYASAYPQNSVFVKFWYKDRLTAVELERLCQRRSALFNATNSRVAFMGLCCGVCAALGVGAKLLSGHEGSYTKSTRNSMQYYQHFEGTLKWLFAVYHHHPAYREHAAKTPVKPIGRRSPMLPDEV